MRLWILSVSAALVAFLHLGEAVARPMRPSERVVLVEPAGPPGVRTLRLDGFTLAQAPVTLMAGEAVPATEPDPLADVPLPPGIPHPELAPLQFAAVLVELARAGKWLALVNFGLFGLIFIARKLFKRLPETSKLAVALRSKWGGWGLNFATALTAGLGTLGFFSVVPTVGNVIMTILGALGFALGAAGVNEFVKDLTTARNEAAAAKGEAAAGEVKTIDDAARVIGKGPPGP